jgi:flavodoxin
MKTVVIYASRHGNTQRVADAIADGLRPFGPVESMSLEVAQKTFDGNADLVVIGGPTEAHGMTPQVRSFLDSLSARGLNGVRAAAFDTRLDWPRWLSGSAGAGIAEHLRKMGADVVVPQASFLVEGKEPQLKPGELRRAVAWGDTLARLSQAHAAAVS